MAKGRMNGAPFRYYGANSPNLVVWQNHQQEHNRNMLTFSSTALIYVARPLLGEEAPGPSS